MFLYIFKSFHSNIITCHSCLTTGNYLLRIYACVYVILGSKINEVTAPAMVQISELFVCSQTILAKSPWDITTFFLCFYILDFLQNYVINPPPPPPLPFNVEVGVRTGNFFIQFSTLNGVGVGVGRGCCGLS